MNVHTKLNRNIYVSLVLRNFCDHKFKFLISIFFKFNTSCYLYVVSLDQKHPFWANLVQKIKTVSLS